MFSTVAPIQILTLLIFLKLANTLLWVKFCSQNTSMHFCMYAINEKLAWLDIALVPPSLNIFDGVRPDINTISCNFLLAFQNQCCCISKKSLIYAYL
jgi:hypothetical protein